MKNDNDERAEVRVQRDRVSETKQEDNVTYRNERFVNFKRSIIEQG